LRDLFLTNSKEMPDINKDRPAQQPGINSALEANRRIEDASLFKTNIVSEEMEEWDRVSTDQRRPQFRSAENYGRRNARE
jgi:hypothetical protein